MKELQPANQQVLLNITGSDQEQRTVSGIIIPDTAKEKNQMGVIAGMSAIDNPEIKPGDTVLDKQYSGTEIEF